MYLCVINFALFICINIMSFNFLKIHAAGNDFVVIDSVGKNYKEFSKPEIIKICNRKYCNSYTYCYIYS